jgi:hypothetical protein
LGPSSPNILLYSNEGLAVRTRSFTGDVGMDQPADELLDITNYSFVTKGYTITIAFMKSRIKYRHFFLEKLASIKRMRNTVERVT